MCKLSFIRDEKQAVIFVGLQASGKTTFYNKMLSNGMYEHISLDNLHTRNKENRALTDCINTGRSFVIDNTNPEVIDRALYIQTAKKHKYRIIGIFFQSVMKDCVKRNNERNGKIPSIAIANTSNRLQIPSMEEGFDELYFVRIENNTFNISKWEE